MVQHGWHHTVACMEGIEQVPPSVGPTTLIFVVETYLIVNLLSFPYITQKIRVSTCLFSKNSSIRSCTTFGLFTMLLCKFYVLLERFHGIASPVQYIIKWGISSVGQSVCMAYRRSGVRVSYTPPFYLFFYDFNVLFLILLIISNSWLKVNS